MENSKSADPGAGDIVLRPPDPRDAPAANRLIAGCPPLDTNSVYCNLLQCTHFAGTSCVATEQDNQDNMVGFLSAYLLPDRPDTLFVWQVAVAAQVRGRRLARNMIDDILRRSSCAAVRQLQTTITPGNDASWSLFRRLADDMGVACQESRHFLREEHFAEEHEDEYLLTLGPWITRREQQDWNNHTILQR